jgi:hypothetical protein
MYVQAFFCDLSLNPFCLTQPSPKTGEDEINQFSPYPRPFSLLGLDT